MDTDWALRGIRTWALAGAVGACVALGGATVAHAAPLHPWGGHFPEAKLGIILYQNWAITARSTHSKTWFIGGINERLDYAFAQAVIIDGQRTLSPVSEFLVRYFPIDGLGIAARGTFNAGQFGAMGPELHFQRKWKAFQLTANAAFRPPIQPRGPIPALAILAPEVFLHPRLSVYAESDATYDFRSGRPTLVVTPGLSAVLDKDGRKLISAGVEVGLVPQVHYLVGAWLLMIFDAP